MERAVSLPKAVRLPLAAAYLLITAAAGAALYFADPSKTMLVPCVFHLATGLDCPGCGMTRAFHALLHLQLLRALRYNLFCIVAAPALAVLWAEGLSVLMRGRAFRMPLRIPTWLLVVFGVLVLAFTVLRNIPVAPFMWMKA